ncbi:MAG: cytochrome C oxidase subunit III [Hydrogenothermaceae bacterium]|nr:cytochrome C oxidase subunit III [Hydrogenothermaceae bacterium]
MAGHLENTRAIDKITYVTDAIPTWWVMFWIGYILFTVSYIVFDWVPDFLSWMSVVGQGAEAADKHIWLRELIRN